MVSLNMLVFIWALMSYFRIPHTTSVCYPRVHHGYSVYRRRRDRICPRAFYPIPRCRNWVRIATVFTLDHPNNEQPCCPRHRVCSVGALYFYGGDNIRKQTENGLEIALGEHLIVFKPLEVLSSNDPSPRCLCTFIPILGPKICQGSDSSDAHCHGSRDRRILRQGDIQSTSVGVGGRASPRTVQICHCF